MTLAPCNFVIYDKGEHYLEYVWHDGKFIMATRKTGRTFDNFIEGTCKMALYIYQNVIISIQKFCSIVCVNRLTKVVRHTGQVFRTLFLWCSKTRVYYSVESHICLYLGVNEYMFDSCHCYRLAVDGDSVIARLTKSRTSTDDGKFCV